MFLILCSILFFLYALMGFTFALAPKTTISFINYYIGEGIFGLKPSPLLESAFLSALAAGMMATILLARPKVPRELSSRFSSLYLGLACPSLGLSGSTTKAPGFPKDWPLSRPTGQRA
jgi:hypothetical protein